MRQLRKLYTNLTHVYRSDMGYIAKQAEEQICGIQDLFSAARLPRPDPRVEMSCCWTFPTRLPVGSSAAKTPPSRRYLLGGRAAGAQRSGPAKSQSATLLWDRAVHHTQDLTGPGPRW